MTVIPEQTKEEREAVYDRWLETMPDDVRARWVAAGIFHLIGLALNEMPGGEDQ